MDLQTNILQEVPQDANIDVIVCLSAMLNKRNEVTWVLESRLQKAVEIFQQHPESHLILSGGTSHLEKEKRSVSDAEAMFSYISSKYSLDNSRITLEKDSSGTVDQFYHIKTKWMIPNKWKSVAIVTDEFHIKRAGLLAKVILGDGYDFYLVGSEINLGGRYREVIERLENEYYDITLRDFSKFKLGDHESILQFYREYQQKKKESMANGEDWLKPIKI